MTMKYKQSSKENTSSQNRLLNKYTKDLDQLKKETNKSWQEENKDFIDEYNERIARNGVFSDGLRSF